MFTVTNYKSLELNILNIKNQYTNLLKVPSTNYVKRKTNTIFHVSAAEVVDLDGNNKKFLWTFFHILRFKMKVHVYLKMPCMHINISIGSNSNFPH